NAITCDGSIVGTCMPVLLIIPPVGTSFTFLLFAGLLMLVDFAGLAMLGWRHVAVYLWMPIVLAVLAALTLRGSLRPPPLGAETIYEDESAYNYIQVARWGEANLLLLNEGQGIHSMYYPNYPDFIETGGTWDYYLAA